MQPRKKKEKKIVVFQKKSTISSWVGKILAINEFHYTSHGSSSSNREKNRFFIILAKLLKLVNGLILKLLWFGTVK